MILVAFESLFIRMYYTILIPSMASMTVDLLLVDYINYYESFRITIVHWNIFKHRGIITHLSLLSEKNTF